MRLRFLGTGTSTGNPEIGCHCAVCTSKDKKDVRFRTSALLEINGKQLLIDCGPDFRAQMLDCFKLRPIEFLEAVLVTHEHYDHVGGLDDLRIFSRKGQIVDIYAEKYVADAIQMRIPYVFRENKYPGVPDLRMNVIENEAFFIKDIEIIPVRLMHGNLPILGYRIGNLAYLTDLKTIPEEEYTKLQGLDVLIINALREKEHTTHETIAQALENIEKIKPRKAYFTHISHTFGLHEAQQKTLPANVFIAYDGLEIDV